MTPSVPSSLLQRASRWNYLKRWERRELGQELRRLGLSYGEIAEIVPVTRGTLSGWCRDVELDEELRERLRKKRPAQMALIEAGARRRSKTAARDAGFVRAAREEAQTLARDARWMAGIIAYWAEGAKRPKPELRFANSDPGLVILFVEWAREFLQLEGQPFDARLHLHDGQEEQERRVFWSVATGIPLEAFRKAYIKPEGTGHRKNVLYNGTISIRVRRSGRHYHRVMGWIEGVNDVWAASSTG